MYIRTKDGVYEELDTTEQGVWTIYGNFIENNEILKQSENLEELCDEFVYNGYLYQVTLLNNCLIEDSFEELREPITDEMIKEGIYGAVWCEFGLKYVAKLNSKGELELI